MRNRLTDEEHVARVLAAGLPNETATRWLNDMASADLSRVPDPSRVDADAAAVGPLFAQGRAFSDALPLKSRRSPVERAAGESIVELMAALCKRFCRVHREAIYRALTDDFARFLRTDRLLWTAAARWPGLVPSRQEVQREAQRMQMDKDGLEIHQGIFLSQMLAGQETGLHLLNAMMRPRPESLDLLPEFRDKGVIEIDNTRLEIRGPVAFLTTSNPRYLNAEDDEVNGPQEIAVDLALLHPDIQMGVLRGAPVDHPRYAGRRIFDAGINLTKIYHGKISYLFYLDREAGIYNKIYRGITQGDWDPQTPEETIEKPWLAAVDTFAIGGGCQLLLVVDYVIAEQGAYCNLPARKEGIIPGAANLRLPRFVGERMARQGIMFDKTFSVDGPEAAALVNEVVARDDMDEAIRGAIDNALGSGMVSAAGNRKALRIVTEPLDAHRRYMALYCEEQAYCHLSEQLIQNLEKNWNAKQRDLKPQG